MRIAKAIVPLFVFAAAVFPAVSQSQSAQDAPQRQIAITIDDLPAASAQGMTGAEILAMTTKLLGTLTAQKVPAVGFVNESKLYIHLDDVQPRIKALSLWTDGGFELGNHTYSHMSLNNNTLAAWEEEVVRGETVTRMLLAQHHMKMRYFRHPFLDTGRDIETRRQAEMFLAQRGYRIAPVTMDAWDWMFAGPYAYARKNGDAALQQRVVNEYLSYTTTVFDYYEKFSKDLLGYEPRQILLLHGNWLEADHMGELLDLLRKRGYQFVTLDRALGDQAYGLPNTYVGEEGEGWIDQWAITMGKIPQHTPAFPQWVIDKSKEISAPREPVTPVAPQP
ncbi:MAG: polysaccharide deacetylase family protein [Candidatus Acidiferrales bacterium]